MNIYKKLVNKRKYSKNKYGYITVTGMYIDRPTGTSPEYLNPANKIDKPAPKQHNKRPKHPQNAPKEHDPDPR